MLKKNTRIAAFFYCTCLLITCACTARQGNPAYSREIEDKIKQVENNLSGEMHIQDSMNTYNLQQRMKDNGIFGVSIAVIHNYKLEWARGYGTADIATQTPVTSKTLFQAASISKSLNGVGLLKLAQDSKVDLYADINTYLTSWKFPYDTVSHGTNFYGKFIKSYCRAYGAWLSGLYKNRYASFRYTNTQWRKACKHSAHTFTGRTS